MKKNIGTKLFEEIKSLLVTLLESLVIVLVIVNFIARPVRVQGNSMYPTLHDSEIGISNVLGIRLNHINRSDIVIVYIESRNEYLVKRVVGLPGDKVKCVDNEIYINGNILQQSYLDSDYTAQYSIFTSDFDEIELMDDEYFLLGDNRPHSSDSRVYGPFKREQIVAKGIFVLWPFKEFGVKAW